MLTETRFANATACPVATETGAETITTGKEAVAESDAIAVASGAFTPIVPTSANAFAFAA